MDTSQEALLKKYNQLYLAMILRYKDYIEEQENLNVAELPKLITPQDDDVLNVANRIKNTFDPYSYHDNYVAAAKRAYDYVKSEIASVSLPIEFWLRPSDTIKSGAGDIFDQATLLCSILIALGNIGAKVITVVKPTERRFVVYSEFNGNIIAFDLEKGYGGFDNQERLFDSLALKGDDITAYEFNEKMYNDLV
ncbi:MAG: hypothetical protein ACREBF_04530 [Candidatus Micrarchaeales archaeon]